ncbi:MAG: Rpp14/Pop5 family protein [Candidatus Micrarchaeota archaeon]
MTVKPTMRDKRRYVSFKIEAEMPVSEKEAFDAIFCSILSFLGEFGYSKANPKQIRFDQKTGFGVIRCSATEVENVRASLAYLSKIVNRKAAVRLLSNSGSMKKLKQRLARE